jgi:hypothetical protein
MQNWPGEYCANLWWGQHFCSFSEEHTRAIEGISIVALALIIGVAGLVIFRKVVSKRKKEKLDY